MSEPHKTLGTPGGVGQPSGEVHGAPTDKVANPSPASNGAHTTTPTNGAMNTPSVNGGANTASTNGATPAVKAEGAAVAPAGVANNAKSTPTGAHGSTVDSASAAQNSGTKPVEQRIQFHSAQTSQAVKPKDYFAEQNAKQAEKNQASAKTRKRLLIILGAVIGVVVVALVAWLVVWLTQDHADDEVPAPTSMQNEAQAAYEAGGNSAAAIKDFFNKRKAEATSNEEVTELLVVEASTYSANGLWEDAASVAEEANGRVDSMTEEQLGRYYGTLFNVYMNLGDTAAAEHYYNLSIEQGVTYDGEEVQG